MQPAGEGGVRTERGANLATIHLILINVMKISLQRQNIWEQVHKKNKI